jgi:molybdopterin synthase sulfur carrier subunit
LSNVKVIFSTAFWNFTNNEKEVLVEASSVGEALKKLVIKYGDEFKNSIFESEQNKRRFINIYVNGKDIRHLDSFETSLNADDEITLLPAVTGG